MAGLDSSKSVSFRQSQRKARSHRAASLIEDTEAREEDFSKPIQLQFCDQYYHRELILTSCD